VKELNRLGPQEKCPACGWRLDADAYRCPKCMIYFCFKCRRRVAARDPQYQCLNQQCKYYGKLLCEVCINAVPEYKTYRKNIPEYHHTNGAWRLILGCTIALGCACLIFASFGVGVWAAVIAAITGTVIAAVKKKPIFDYDHTTYSGLSHIMRPSRGLEPVAS
jgi:hypothetical protein